MAYNPQEDPNLKEFRAEWNGLSDIERGEEHRLNLKGMLKEGAQVKLDPELMEVPAVSNQVGTNVRGITNS